MVPAGIHAVQESGVDGEAESAGTKALVYRQSAVFIRVNPCLSMANAQVGRGAREPRPRHLHRSRRLVGPRLSLANEL